MMYTSHQKSQARAFDHLYDPIYHTGGIRDVERENNRASLKTAPSYIFTKFGCMFSDHTIKPNIIMTLQNNKLPITPSKPSMYDLSAILKRRYKENEEESFHLDRRIPKSRGLEIHCCQGESEIFHCFFVK